MRKKKNPLREGDDKSTGIKETDDKDLLESQKLEEGSANCC